MQKIEIVQGSLLDAKTDTIVNPANGHLNHGGGVAALIAKAATAFPAGFVPPASQSAREDLFDERDRYLAEAAEWRGEQEDHPLIATGDAGWTSAGALTQFKGIVHAVGPIWGGGSFYEEDLLMQAVESSLRVAEDHGCTSIAFPAISAGIFGVPITVVSEALLRSALFGGSDYPAIERIVFYLFEQDHVDAFFKTAGTLGIEA